jgi:hypothetical protein
MIAVGQRVRHLKQAAWGVGVVTENNKAGGGLVELVIEFETGERRLKLKPEAVEVMIAVLTADESAAVDQQNAEDEAAAATEAKARTSRMKAKRHEARARLEVNCMTIADSGDGHAILSLADGAQCLRVCQPDGSVVEEIVLPDPGSYVALSPGSRFVPTDLMADGRGMILGTRTHNWGVIMFARRGQSRGRMWRAPIDLGVTHVAVYPGVGAVIHDLERMFVAREEGTSHEVPLALNSRKIDRATVWDDGILLGAHGGAEDHDYFRYLYVGTDGALRHEGEGGSPVPLGDLMLTFDPRGALARDRQGTVTGRLDRPVKWGSTSERKGGLAFARIDEELVFSLGGDQSGLVRWHPRTDQPRWVSVLSPSREGFAAPVRVGRYIAVTNSEYSTDETPKVWIVDAETGALVHSFELKKPVSKLVAVGDDAIVASSFSKQPIAWRGLATAKPERLLLTLPSNCSDVISPAPGVVVTVDSEGVSFFEL